MKNIVKRDYFRAAMPCLLAAAVCCAPVQAHPPEGSSVERSISVTGIAESSAEPDLVSIRFGVEVRRPTSRAALAANASLMERVVTALEQEGIGEDEISTSRFNIHAVYDSRPDPETGGRTQVLNGYQVSNIILVETGRLDRVGPLIDAAVAAGVNRVDGVQFMLSRGARAKLKSRLIGSAVMDARSKAREALEPLGYRIVGVLNMSLDEFATPAPRYADAGRIELAQAAPTPIFASEQDVSATVRVTFLIGPVPEAD